MSDDLVAFLKARLDEDEREAEHADDSNVVVIHYAGNPDPHLPGGGGGGSSWSPQKARMLREVAAKREILASHASGKAGCDWCPYERICYTVRLLATVYQDHPDYRPEWADQRA